MFAEMWPLIQANIPNNEHRIEFTASLLTLMAENDMDPYDIEDIHSEGTTVSTSMHWSTLRTNYSDSLPQLPT